VLNSILGSLYANWVSSARTERETELLLHECTRAAARYFSAKAPCEDVADLTQDAMIAVAKGLSGVRDQSMFQSWLYRVLRNKLVDYLKKRNAHSPAQTINGEEPIEIISPAPDPHVQFRDSETLRKVMEAIQRLTPIQSQCILLAGDDEPYKNIARLLGITEAKVRQHVFIGRRELKAELGAELPWLNRENYRDA